MSSGPRYLPILKSRQGELTALKNLDDVRGDVDGMTPIIEVVDVDIPGELGARSVRLDRITSKLVAAWPPGRPRAVIDTVVAEGDPEEPAWDQHESIPDAPSILTEIFTRLRGANVRAVPVMRLSDPHARRSELRNLTTWSTEPGACLRIGTEDLDDQVKPLDRAVEDYLDHLDLDPSEVDLVVDFAAVDDDHTAAMASRLAKFVMPALDRYAWRSFALGAGGFPVNLGEVSAYKVTRIPRRDRQLWAQLNKMSLRRQLDYSDYAVTHPLLQTGVAFAAPPQIRYTAGDGWWVAKGRRNDRRGHRQFFDICGRVRSEHPSDIAPPERSWGSNEFLVAADKAGLDAEGMGNASTWRAIATSHHLGYVLHQLRTRGEP